jgi:HEAT repeat protein
MSIGPLVKAVSSEQEDKDVRIAAVQALKHYKTTEVARTLINTLQLKDFGISWQARRSLITMTNQDFRYDEAQWLDYLNKKPLG